MPNIMLTTRCNFQCSYCFGIDLMESEQPVRDMTRATFRSLLAWLQKAPFPGNTVHLMGGEPTLHDDLVWFAETAAAQGFDVSLFTNAAAPQAPKYAEKLRHLALRWIVNVNPPESRTVDQDRALRESLRILGEQVTLTLNMEPAPVSYDWVLDLIFQYQLKPKIKIGFILPTLSHRNHHLSREEYPKAAERVVEFARQCDHFGLGLEYECGVPWCAFSDHQLGQLWHFNAKFYSNCHSILDITPDGFVVYCLPLATFRAVSFHQFENYPAAKAWYESVLTPYRPMGTTAHCFACHLMRTGVCRGGCLARILHGAHNIF